MKLVEVVGGFTPGVENMGKRLFKGCLSQYMGKHGGGRGVKMLSKIPVKEFI